MYDVMVCGPENLERELVAKRVGEALPDACLFVSASRRDTLRAVSLEGVRVLVSLLASFDYSTLGFLRWVKEVSPATRFVVVSSVPLYSVANSVALLGVSSYFVRPVRPELLVRCISAQLGELGSVPSAGRDAIAACAPDDSECRAAAVSRHLSEQLHALRYAQCVDVLRSYLEFSWECARSQAQIEADVLRLVDVVYDVAPESLHDDRDRLKATLRFKLSQPHGLYDVTCAFEQLVGRIFDGVADERARGVSDVQRIRNYIDRNVRLDLSLADAAGFANMSPSYFSKYFKREVGKNYVTYLTEHKMALARRMLLQSGLSVVQISNELSYSRPSYFSKTFKKAVGLPPTEFRDKHLADTAATRS